MTNPNGPMTGRPAFRSPNGMIATSHYLASGAGLRVLRQGGSASDALIAANAVLCVAYPHMAGLGGDGFWLVHAPEGGGVEALNASGPAARLATRDYYREHGHTDEIPDRSGYAALTVPGAVDGWRMMHEKYGRLPWQDLFDEAIFYAREGVPIARSLSDWLAEDQDVFEKYESSGRIFMPGGKRLREGQKLTQADLARSLERIARDGARAAFYEGGIADEICRSLASEGSPLRPDDFAAFRAEWVDPISTTYRDYTAYEFPPNTQGFAALQILNLIEDYDIRGWGDNTADYYHYMAEAVKLAFADRDAWLTDPKFVDIPLDRLLSKDYASERRDLIDPGKAMKMEEVEPGVEFEHDDDRREVDRRDEDGVPPRRSPDGDTVYLCAVDRDGLAVSMIQSIYHDFGAGVVGGDTGIILQNRGSFFSLHDKHPNRLEPGKRTFHTLIPAMLLRGDEPYLVYGTMGGEGQPQTHAALVTRIVDFEYDVQQAIEAPRWLMGRTWGPESRDLSLEGRIPDGVMRELEMRGQPIKPLTNWNDNMGHAQAIRIDRENGWLEGGADPRGDGLALGY
jgi:oxamate amidohydrolase